MINLEYSNSIKFMLALFLRYKLHLEDNGSVFESDD